MIDRRIEFFNMTDAEIGEAFEGTSFGSKGKRALLVGYVLKSIVGYHSGSTLNHIARELGFVTEKGNITIKGKWFMFNNIYESVDALED